MAATRRRSLALDSHLSGVPHILKSDLPIQETLGGVLGENTSFNPYLVNSIERSTRVTRDRAIEVQRAIAATCLCRLAWFRSRDWVPATRIAPASFRYEETRK
jgi:hypothetical protein